MGDPRTLMSALSNLAGLFPPEGSDVWEPGLAWQPIPVHTVSAAADNLLSSHADCPRQAQLLHDVLTSPQVRALDEANRDLYDYLTQKTGTNVSFNALLW